MNSTLDKFAHFCKDTSGEWKETTSFSQTDLAVVSQLTGQAFQEIVKLKQQGVRRA